MQQTPDNKYRPDALFTFLMNVTTQYQILKNLKNLYGSDTFLSIVQVCPQLFPQLFLIGFENIIELMPDLDKSKIVFAA